MWQFKRSGTCHIFAGVVAHTLHHGVRAAVAHRKALRGHAPEEGLALFEQVTAGKALVPLGTSVQ